MYITQLNSLNRLFGFKKIANLFIIMGCTLLVSAQTYNISNDGDVSTCSGTFYDDGGSAGLYSLDTSFTQTFCSSTVGQCLRAVFTAFSTEANYDILKIYDGNTTSSAFIGKYSGTTSPGTVTASSGCLTFNFTSDISARSSGWAANLSCVACPACTGTTPACGLPDDCNTACNLGTLSNPDCGTPKSDKFCLTNVGATAPNPYYALSGCSGGDMPNPSADVWYKFVLGSNTNVLNINITGAIKNPSIGLYEGTDCNNMIGRSCAVGTGNNVNLNLGQVTPGGTYYIQISGGTLIDVGKITVTINSSQDCSSCVQSNSLTASPGPVNGSYQDGQAVRFCFSVQGYSPTLRNWLHGVIPSFGPGWDLSTLTVTPSDIPASCIAGGEWLWYPTPITSSSSGLQYGPGFFFNQSGGDVQVPFYPLETDPGDNFGDGNIAGDCTNHVWTFCFTIATKKCPIDPNNQGLNVSINTTADSESGSWSSSACAGDLGYNFVATTRCCPDPIVVVTPASCPSTDGKVVVTANGTGPYFYTYYNSSNVAIKTALNKPDKDSITTLVPGDYSVLVIDTFSRCREIIPFTIIDNGTSLVASVIINADQNNVCAGTNITFTATPTNPGASPAYKWLLNNTVVGSNSPTYSNASLNNGDKVKVILTSSLTCVSNNPDTSNVITMVITPVPVPTVTASVPSNTICAGTSTTFTATPTNGGPTPQYQWFINNTAVSGATNPTFTSSTLVNGDKIKVGIKSRLACANTATFTMSNVITMTVNASKVVSVNIIASENPFCAGNSVTFTATPTNGGAAPAYQWLLNNSPVGSNSPTYSSSTLNNGDKVAVVLTSNIACPTSNPDTSNVISMSEGGGAPVSVSISASDNPICSGTSVTFTAIPTNGGSAPVYQWLLNNNPVGANSPTYSNASLANGDQVKVKLTSNSSCATNNPDTSNIITMVVTPTPSPSVTASVPSNTICAGTSTTFTATPTNGGPTPQYQWFINNTAVSGATNPTFTSSVLANGDKIKVGIKSSLACANTATFTMSNVITMTVNASKIVSVNIIASENPFCAGNSVTFTATPTNGGAAPAYQWLLNNSLVGSNSPTYSSSTLNNGDKVAVVLTSNIACPTSNPDTSNIITMSEGGGAPVSVSISANNNPICFGTSVTFTAIPTNGGSAPVYQWLLNNNPVGANSPTYSNASLANGDQVKVKLTSNSSCATNNPDTSNIITMVVNPTPTPSVTASVPSNTICAGTLTTFTAVPTNGGPTPQYQWFINNIAVPGETNSTFSSSTLASGDKIKVGIKSSLPCADIATFTMSNIITMTVNAPNIVSVTISATATSICSGASVTFTATPVNGGLTPVFQWLKNGSIVGSNSATYTTATLNNGDQIAVVLTSNVSCATSNPDTSNIITITVNSQLPVSVSIVADQNPICAGNKVTFTATPTNEGSSPVYQWLLNNNPVGTNSTTYANAALNNGDQIKVSLTSNNSCATGNPALSNTVTVTVSSALPVSVTVAASANPICPSENVTFTATPVNGGATPTYQWYLNSNPVGSNSSTFSSASINNNDQVHVVLTSSSTCATGNPATSNTILMAVSSTGIVSVSIAASDNPICINTPVTFSATPINGGTTPAYQWYLNNSPVGSDSPTYANSTLANGDQIKVVLTSSSSCATGNPATSNTVIMTVNSALPVSVSVASSGNSICYGTAVTFTATPINGGAAPVYQWLLNGSPVGSNSPTYSNSTLANGDQVKVVLTSNSSCATGSPATSNTVSMAVNAPLIVDIGPDQNICEGQTASFDAGNTGATFKWNSGQSSQQITTDTAGTYIVTVSNGGCSTKDTAILTVQPALPLELGPDEQLCSGTSLTLNTGISGAIYEWSTGESTPSITVNTNGTYVVTVTKDPCTATDQVQLNFDLLPPIAFNLGQDTLLCLGESILLDAGTQDNVTYLWQDGSSSTTMLASEDGNYYAIISNKCGTVSDTILISTEDCSCRVFVPTAFSPNGDGNNDLFQPITTCEVTNYRFSVFNRWNEMVFDSNDPSKGWDGIYKGQPQTVDTYIYSVNYTVVKTGEQNKIRGVVTLLR